jgi:hypothetical protein
MVIATARRYNMKAVLRHILAKALVIKDIYVTIKLNYSLESLD